MTWDRSVDVVVGGIDALDAVVVEAATAVVLGGTVVVVAVGSVPHSTSRTAKKTRITAADLTNRRYSCGGISNNT